MKNYLKRTTTFILALLMLLSVPLQAFAEVNYDNLAGDKAKIINELKPVKPAKPESGKTAEDLIKNPEQPAIYTLRTDYKVQRGEKYEVDYQPYIASVGAAATDEEKAKVKKTIKLPDLTGYEKPDDDYKITYDKVMKAGNNGNQEFRYKAKANEITIKHVFQDLYDFTKYTNPDGSIGEKGQLITTQNGNTGSTMEVSPLDEKNPNRKGFVPEAPFITMQVPENAENFILEYRYNRAHYDVVFDTAGGTPVPARTLYYEQIIPKIADESIPTKAGGIFQGWKPSHDLQTTDGKTYQANEIIKYPSGNSINNLAANLKMPAENVTFTAVWKDKPKAEYAIQFWTEKPDYDDKNETLPLRDRYDFIGARRIDDADTGSTPDLTNLDIHGITFPDLNDGRLEKAQDSKEEFERYYFLNEDLTKKQNASEKDPNIQKTVSSTGETVYNVYYNRRVYTLYFTAASGEAFDIVGSFWPIITRDGQVIGKEGSPYKVDVRFNQSLDGIWPKDAEVSNLPTSFGNEEGDTGLIGWTINNNAGEQAYRDTPPYRLSAEDFIDSQDVVGTGEFEGFGHSDQIPIKDGKNKKRDKYEISIGSTSYEQSVVHHIDIIKDDFDGKEQIDYDMSYWKSDTSAAGPNGYPFGLPHLQGFTLKEDTRTAEWIGLEKGRVGTWDARKTFDELNAQRNKKTPFRSDADKIEYIDQFPWGTKSFKGANAYNYANYTRNKYKLKLNNDPKTVKNDSEYGEGNILDVPYELSLNDLKLDTTHKPKKPNWVRDDWSFLGWALDPAGDNLVKDGNETKLHYDQILYAKWGEPDYKWKVIFDPNGGSLRTIDENKLTTERKTLKEGDVGQEIETTYPIKENSEGDKQVFKVVHKQKLVEPKFKPVRKGYDFMGWEIIRYIKDEDGNYTDEIDNSYRETYKVPELYSFGNDVVSPIYLKAIWVPNARVDVKVLHYYLDKDYNLDKSISPNPDSDTLENKRADYLVATTGDRQDDKYTLVPHDELNEKLTGDLKTIYEEYNNRVGLNNSFFQTFRVEPAEIPDPEDSEKMIPNPDVKNNVFKFFYRPYRHREYKVNYIDESFKGKENEKAGAIIDQELVVNGNRHYDARNYRPIPGWVLTSAPQQQLFFDLNEETNELIGINGTGKDEITFYYKDVRVIEVPTPPEGQEIPDPPKGYVRVTFKADKGGAFTDNTGKSVTELHYDVIKGLKSDLLPVPEELGTKADGTPNDKVEGKYYITPETGKKFTKWDEKPLLNKNTIVDNDTNDFYVFTAKFEWSGLTAKGMVRTEAFKDPNGNWTNDFAPTIDQLKAQLEWREKDQVKPLPTGTVIKLFDENDNELTTDDKVFELVNEKKAADKDEVVRTVNIKAKVTFPDKKDPQELDIPITVYKNVYEALNKAGDKPLFLKEAEGKDAKDGGLKDILKENTENRYIKVTVKPNKDFDNKDDKVYYVNPNAWVEIPKVKTDGDSNFTNWTADIVGQNDDGKKDGIFDFGKRHKFTEDTIIRPVGAGDIVEQTDPNKKPPVPDSYVKVIVDKTAKAELGTEEKQTQTFWVNPTKEVTIDVTNPTGKTVAADQTVGAVGYTMDFSKWESTETTARVWTDKIVGKFENDTTILAKYSVTPEEIKPIVPATDTVHTPQGKTPTVDEIKDKITPPEGKIISKVTIVENPDVDNPGNSTAKVIVEYTDGSSVGTNDKPLEVPVEVHKNIIPEAPGGQRPKDALDNYVKVIFKAGTGGKLEGTLTGNFIYYVSPEVEVDMTEVAEKINKTPDTGYFVNGENWNNRDNKALRGTFTDPETVFEFVFDKSTDIVGKTDDSVKKPDGYVTVTFRADAHGKLEGDKTEKIYYVNPKAGIKLVELADGQTAGEKELAVPKTVADENYVFEKWYEAIDKKNPVTNNLEHVARFVKDGVTLTYNANGAEGKVPEGVTVAQGTSVRLASAAGLTKKDAKFAGWKIGKDIYQAGDLVTLEESKTAVAQWTNDKNIIPYDPSDPITRPDDTYVRVTFEADDGLKLTESKAYYVKKDANITLAELEKPAYDEKTGYTFDKWDKEDTLVITQDTLVKAKANPIPDTIEKKDGVDKPKGYVEVNFTAGINGSLEGDKVYYVNPSKYVTLVPPTPIGDTGFEFSSWDINPEVPRVYTDPVTTITANFNPIDAVSITPKPGYVKIDFVIEGNGGQIAKGETTTYYVDPNRKVTLNAPTTVADTGYEFNTWTPDPKVPQAYNKATTIKGTFTELAPIIPSTDDQGKPNPKPDGYVTVTFDKGEHGTKIEGQTVYYVNPKANKTLGDLTRPRVEEEVGYKFTKWDKLDNKVISEDLRVSAIYDKIPDIIPKDKPNGGENDKPEGYITVSFSAEKNGKLEGTSIYYIKPNTAVALKGLEPKVIPNTGFDFANWDTQIEKKIEYSDGDVIKALYNAKDNVIPQKNTDGSDKPAGYLTVTFDKGEHGKELTGQTVYYVKPNVEVTVPAPSVKANIGYDFKNWDKDLTQTFTKDETITAEYTSKDDIIPQKNTDGSDKPEGYVTVTFKALNGSLEGTTTYYVKPNVEVNLTDTANAITKKADLGYTEEGGTWDKPLKATFTKDAEFTFNFAKLKDVIPKDKPEGGENTIPEGYVSVKFIPTANAQDPTEKVYYVNPKVNVTLPIADPVGKEVTDQSGTKYTFNFKLWTVTRGSVATWKKGTQVSGVFIQDTDITAKYNVEYKELIKGPVPKDNVVTGKGEVPNPNDLIKNIFDPNDPNNKDNLPDGTTFTYTNDGTPDVNNPGETTAKVEVHYPDGKTSVVEVPIKVVDHVVPQTGGENGQKPLVPDTYVKITVDTTDNATPNTKFVKVFWVKPNVEVTIPDILAPTGKVVEEGGVTKTNRFVKWQLVGSDPAKFYETEITDTFTKAETIVATYEFDKNVEPVGKNDQWIPQGSTPSPKDFIENPYDDNDPNNPNNLPPGTKFEFVPGTEPNTTEPGTDKTTTIKVTYPNGEVKEVEVKYNVTGDVVEQPDPNDPTTKPAVPENFVKVTVIPTEKAKDETNRVFWVNPEKVVTIPVNSPEVKDELQNDRWRFSRWDTPLTGTFTSETKITAIYVVEAAPIVPPPNVKYVITDIGVQPTKDKYLEKITPPTGKDIDNIDIIEQPDVNKKGVSSATIKVTYTDGTSVTVKMDVIVQDKYVPPTPDKPDDPYYPERPDYPYYPERPYYPLRPEVRYETIIQEKVVKVPIIDNAYFKEVRYMQGFMGDFRPKDGLTRAEAAQILANALVEDGYKYNPNFKLSYKDIGEAWYTRAVKIVTEANVFEGYDDGNFKPQDKITRNEWIATLKRFQEIGDASGNHMNLRDGHWAMSEIEAAYNEGWLKIYTDGLATYKGDEFIPREEVAAVSNKAFKRVLDKTYIRNNEKSLISYKDVNKDMWSYEDILCASNTFLYKNDLYRAHWVKEDKNVFNIDTRDLNIVQAKFQRNPR